MNAEAKALRERLEGGLIAAVPVPFSQEGEYQEEAEEKLVRYHADSAARGVAVWVHTGRGLVLEPATRREVMNRWRRGLRADQLIIAGVGCPRGGDGDSEQDLSDADYVARAVEMAAEANRLGADGLLVYAPTRFRGRADQDERIEEYHEAIAGTGLALLLFYLYESAGGIGYSHELLGRLLAMDQVAGIKVATLDSVMTFQNIAELVRARAPGLALLSGEDRFLGYTLMRGASGALIGMGAVQPDRQAELIESWRSARLDRFVELSAAIDAFAETTFIEPMEGYIRRLMIALSLEGVLPAEAAFDPWGPPVAQSEAQRIGDALERLRGR